MKRAVLAAAMRNRLPVWRSRPPIQGYQLVFYDDFDGSVLDSSKWAHWQPGARRNATNVESAVSVGNGVLRIRTERSGEPEAYTYTSGGVCTLGKFVYGYGFAEARIKFSAPQDEYWGAFWISSSTIKLGQTAADGVEIDVIESFTNPSHALNWNGYGEGQEYRSQAAGVSDATGWHTYAVHWTPGGYTWSVDGVATWSQGSGDALVSTCQTQYLLLSSEVSGDTLSAVETMDVDWVRVWRLPRAYPTVEVSPPEL